MRLEQFINEGIKILPDEEIDELIERDCQPWLKATSNEIYRGAKNKPSCYKGTVRINRKPTDTPLEIQELIDDVIQKKYGFKPRSSGLFVTGDKSEGVQYGSVYKIYPIGKFKFLWSPIIKDFYAIIQDKYSQIFDKAVYTDSILLIPEMKEAFKKFILTEYTNKDLTAAIRSRKEIMIITKEYYAKEEK